MIDFAILRLDSDSREVLTELHLYFCFYLHLKMRLKVFSEDLFAEIQADIWLKLKT
jgi:hypothetical protein